MYKIIECEQRSDEWFKARLGKWTASFFDKAITTTGKRSTSAEDVNNRLVAELIIGRPDDTFQSEAMLRGAELEDEAIAFINFTYGYNFKKVGFYDSGLGYGCSVDAHDAENDIDLELKIPSLHTHLKYLAGGSLPKDYKAQVQGGMMVTDRRKHVFMSYHPEVKPFVIVVDRDEAYIKEMKSIVEACCLEVQTKYEELTRILSEDEAG